MGCCASHEKVGSGHYGVCKWDDKVYYYEADKDYMLRGFCTEGCEHYFNLPTHKVVGKKYKPAPEPEVEYY